MRGLSRCQQSHQPLPAHRQFLGPEEVRIGTILTAVNHTDLEAEIRRSLFPTSWCCRAALPGMVQAGGGTMVKVSYVSTRDINRVPYAAAKGEVNAITACLALEYAEHGIRVCGVAPGGIERRHGAFRAPFGTRSNGGTGRSSIRQSHPA